MAKIRSPNYPGISLPDAIDRIRKIHGTAHTHKVDSLTMAKAAGYNSLSGVSLTLLSALKKFGLLEEIGNELRVSQTALTIIADPVTSQERRRAIQQCAFAPIIFIEIKKQFPDSIPNDEIVRSYLVKNNFSAASLDVAIRVFRETMKLVTDEGMGYASDFGLVDADAMLEEGIPDQTIKAPPVESGFIRPTAYGGGTARRIESSDVEVGAYPVAKNCTIRLIATGPYTRKSIQALVKQLELNLELDVFPDEPS